MTKSALILASQSKSRGDLMRGAGLEFDQVSSLVDEDAIKAAMRADGETTKRQAEALAEMKAIKISMKHPGIVLGADQMLDLEGVQFDKPKTMEEARENLLKMRGKTHTLETALVACENGQPIWRAATRPKLTMRDFSEGFLDQYLQTEGELALTTVGAYRLESHGAQLFSKIEGDYFSVLGLPLIQLLNWLQSRGDLTQ
ncbi:Maf family protein [Hirschia litorea]|uniref:Nucleoside triphosphate pyrophosphatase n=1 Tax=Hirschia litorea TaxID=1199156 RepID=A0ABW2IMH3_9PROT